MVQLAIGKKVMNTPLSRIFKAARCQTQVELATLLGIQQSSISDAKRRNRVPAQWLVTLLRLRGVNPEWILHGTEPKYIEIDAVSSAESMLPPADREAQSDNEEIVAKLLHCFSTQTLIDELARRRETA